MTLKSSSYLLPKFSRVSLTIVLISGISTIVNGTLLNFGKRYEDNLRVIFVQWPKLYLGLDMRPEISIFKGLVINKNGLIFPICSSMTLRKGFELGRATKEKNMSNSQNSPTDLGLYHHKALYS